VLFKDVANTVRTALLLADALGLDGHAVNHTVTMFLQQDPTPDNDAPMEDYKLHPDGIIATLEKMLADSCSSSDRNSELGTLQGSKCSSEKRQKQKRGNPNTKNQASNILNIKKYLGRLYRHPVATVTPYHSPSLGFAGVAVVFCLKLYYPTLSAVLISVWRACVEPVLLVYQWRPFHVTYHLSHSHGIGALEMAGQTDAAHRASV